jgi:hypothetical protein
MNRVHIMPVLASLLLAAACGGDSPTETATDTRPSVRFVNATTGSGSGGFTINGQFAAGSALAPGQAAQTCSKVDPGTMIFGFGPANSGGTGLSGNPIVTSNNETIAAGGRYTVVATGSATNPSLFVLGTGFSGDLSTSQAAVRFVSFVPATGTTVPNYVFYRGEIGATSPLALGLPFGFTSGYSVVPSGTSTFSAMQTPGNIILVPSSSITLQAGTVNTIALLRDASGGNQLLNIPRCS